MYFSKNEQRYMGVPLCNTVTVTVTVTPPIGFPSHLLGRAIINLTYCSPSSPPLFLHPTLSRILSPSFLSSAVRIPQRLLPAGPV